MFQHSVFLSDSLRIRRSAENDNPSTYMIQSELSKALCKHSSAFGFQKHLCKYKLPDLKTAMLLPSKMLLYELCNRAKN